MLLHAPARPIVSHVAHATPFVRPLSADESDARHGAYDFYAEQLAAPDDLKHLTEENESMAFRRRGYEVRAHTDSSGLLQF